MESQLRINHEYTFGWYTIPNARDATPNTYEARSFHEKINHTMLIENPMHIRYETKIQ